MKEPLVIKAICRRCAESAVVAIYPTVEDALIGVEIQPWACVSCGSPLSFQICKDKRVLMSLLRDDDGAASPAARAK